MTCRKKLADGWSIKSGDTVATFSKAYHVKNYRLVLSLAVLIPVSEILELVSFVSLLTEHFSGIADSF